MGGVGTRRCKVGAPMLGYERGKASPRRRERNRRLKDSVVKREAICQKLAIVRSINAWPALRLLRWDR